MLPYISVFGREITSYGLMMALAVLVVGAGCIFRARSHGIVMEDVMITGAFALGIGLFGAKLVYILVTYRLSALWQMLRSGDLSFLGGGLVFYGGLIGGIFGALLGIRVSKCDLRGMEHTVVPMIPLGHAIGRIGCLLAGCCYGMAYEGPLAVYYPHSVAGVPADQGYFPVQPLESVLNLVICALLLALEKKLRRCLDLLFAYLSMYALTRILLELFRGDSARGIYWGLSSSQWIGLAMLAASGIYFLCRYRKHS